MTRPYLNGLPSERLLVWATGPDARSYRIEDEQSGTTVCEFETAGVNGKTNHETAEANLADASEHADGATLLLYCEGLLMAWATDGLIYSLRPDRPGFLRCEVAA
jgi:hypothetical protein